MKLYKLTDEKGQTHGGTQWGEGMTRKATSKGKSLCSNGYIHAYEYPLLAVLLNPIHANFSSGAGDGGSSVGGGGGGAGGAGGAGGGGKY